MTTLQEIARYMTGWPEDWKLSLNGLSTEEVFAAVLAVRRLRGDDNSL